MFDGNGFVISNLSFKGGTGVSAAGGIFGRLHTIVELGESVEIKNVAFTGVTFKGAACAVLAYQASGTSGDHVKISNIYVQINAQESYQDKCAPLFYESGYLDMNNVVVDYPVGSGYNVPTLSDTDSYLLGSLIMHMQYTGKASQKFSNVYVVSTVLLSHRGGKAELSSQDASNIEGSGFTVVSGAYRYNTLVEMKAANNDYSSFDNACWSLTTGVPVWAKLA